MRSHPGIGLQSLHSKLLILVCMIAGLSAVSMTWLNQTQTYSVARSATIDQLVNESDLAAASVAETIRNMHDDARIIAQTPPIQGLIRTAGNDGVDPQDGSSGALWRARLATIFDSVMQARPAYEQMRYIGIADGGRELVRVNQRNGQNFVVERAALQRKADEPYFAGALATPDGAAYLSDVTFNREFGQIDPREVPTIRLLLPVFTPEGERYGFIAINADYEQLLRQSLANMSLPDAVLISNGNGDYLYAGADHTDIRFDFHTRHDFRPHPLLAEIPREASAPSVGEWREMIYATRTVDLTNIDTPVSLHVTVVRQAALIDAAALSKLPLIIAASVLLIVVSLTITVWAINRVMTPFRDLTRRIAAAETAAEVRDLPVGREDEVGALARAFDHVTTGLLTSETRTRAIIDSVVDGLIVIDETGTIERINPACEKLFGYTADELIGENVKRLMPAEEAARHDRYLEAYNTGGTAQIIGSGREVVGQRKDGSLFPMDLSVSELTLPGRHLYCGIVRDITERKQMDRMKDEFISTVNHEIRTPLTSLVGSLGLLRVKAEGRLDEKGDKLLRLAHESGDRLSVLVNDILDLERIAAGKLDYDIRPADIAVLVTEVIEQAAGLEERHGVHIKLNVDMPDGTQVTVDRNRFHQALGNLLSNAAKYSPKGDTVQVRIAVAPDDDAAVRITVRDNGPGIPENFRDKLFERFSQADGSNTRIEGSSGLGLSITKTLIEAFDGRVEFDSVVGQGSQFHIILPACRAIEPESDAEIADEHPVS